MKIVAPRRTQKLSSLTPDSWTRSFFIKFSFALISFRTKFRPHYHFITPFQSIFNHTDAINTALSQELPAQGRVETVRGQNRQFEAESEIGCRKCRK